MKHHCQMAIIMNGIVVLHHKTNILRGKVMYNKKYLIEKIEEFNDHNPIYDDLEGKLLIQHTLILGSVVGFFGSMIVGLKSMHIEFIHQ